MSDNLLRLGSYAPEIVVNRLCVRPHRRSKPGDRCPLCIGRKSQE
jgi:hypothetical protein